MYIEEVKMIMDSLKLFDKMYEVIRIVDPMNKKVLSLSKESISDTDFNCFDFWGTGKICDNCISIRTYIENQVFVKFEHSPDKLFMITSVPVELNNRRVVIEFLKDATGSMIFNTFDKKNVSEIYTMIDKINSLAMKDSLTGLYNRRFINERLPVDIITSSLSNKDLSIIFTDIDYFKNVNDNYGHIAGDAILIEFTKILSEFITEENQWVARFGGEEFIICLPGISLEEATKYAEQIRKKVEEKEIIYTDQIIKITSSFGVASIKALQEIEKSINVEKLLKSADEKLYEAKKNGRNRVES